MWQSRRAQMVKPLPVALLTMTLTGDPDKSDIRDLPSRGFPDLLTRYQEPCSSVRVRNGEMVAFRYIDSVWRERRSALLPLAIASTCKDTQKALLIVFSGSHQPDLNPTDSLIPCQGQSPSSTTTPHSCCLSPYIIALSSRLMPSAKSAPWPFDKGKVIS